MASDATPIPRRSSRQRWAKGLRRAWARRMRALARALNPQATAKRSCVRSPRFRESVVTRDPHFWCRGASLQATPEPSLAAVRPSINRNFVAEEGSGRRNWRPRLGGGYNRQAAFGGQRLGTTQRTLRGDFELDSLLSRVAGAVENSGHQTEQVFRREAIGFGPRIKLFVGFVRDDADVVLVQFSRLWWHLR